jgi:hypothetical protein
MKAIRRRRRARRGSATARVVGAWREGRENLGSHGTKVSTAMTIDDAARAIQDSIGDEAATRVRAFAPIVNTALYAPVEPDEQAALFAWEAEATLRAFLKEKSTASQRAFAAIDPRPLLKMGGRAVSDPGSSS